MRKIVILAAIAALCSGCSAMSYESEAQTRKIEQQAAEYCAEFAADESKFEDCKTLRGHDIRLLNKMKSGNPHHR